VGRHFGREATWQRADGSTIYVRENSRVVRDDAGHALYYEGIVEDITERKRLEAQLRQSQKLESIGTLASGVAHEINNPLMGMINYAELISLRCSDPDLRSYAEEIKVEGTRVSGIVEWTLSLMQALLKRHFIDVRIDVPANLPKVQCRSQQIQQVLLNLLTNAKDALNERYPEADENKVLALSAEAFHKNGMGWVRLTVEDHGTGIAPEIIDRVFDPFFTTKPRDQGTGLGLSISYGIVREHGGELTVDTAQEGVTRFHVVLPTVEESPLTAHRRAATTADGTAVRS
jgi:signal transduction histidine kinase